MTMENFLNIPKENILIESDLFFIVYDAFPVSPGHILIISKSLKKTFFDLDEHERNELPRMIVRARDLIEKKFKPHGYNIGMNCGEVSGQSIMHFHCHVIPRYKGDLDNPRGGVRGVVPDKMNY